MLANGRRTYQDVPIITDAEKLLIYAYLQGAVYCWCKNRPSEWFSARKLVGKDNYHWEGTPAYPLFQHFYALGKGGAYAVDEAGKALGHLLKRVIVEDKRTFETRRGYKTREYRWTGAEDNNHWPDWLPHTSIEYTTVEEICADGEKAVYHFFSASIKDDILREGLLVSKEQSRIRGEKWGTYVVWSDDIRVLNAIAGSQAVTLRNGKPVDKLCRVKINLRKYGITARDLAPDLHGGAKKNINFFCCKIVKDVKNIDPADIEVWEGRNGDTEGIDFYNLKGYNIEHKPEGYDMMALAEIYPKIEWKQY